MRVGELLQVTGLVVRRRHDRVRKAPAHSRPPHDRASEGRARDGSRAGVLLEPELEHQDSEGNPTLSGSAVREPPNGVEVDDVTHLRR